MDFLPHSLTVTVTGMILYVPGIVKGNVPMIVVGVIVCVVGIVWLNFACDKLIVNVKRIRRHERQVESVRNQVESSDLIARAADRKATEAAKNRQHIKGYVKQGDNIINFEKEVK